MTDPLHIVRLVLDRRELARLARRQHLGRGVDDGYVLHAGLAQLFASSNEPAQIPLHTFAMDDTLPQAQRQPESVFLLAYSDLDEESIKSRMGPSRHGLLRACIAKEAPALPAGSKAGFRVRICPIVRTRRPLAGEPPVTTGARTRCREVDAWLATRVRASEPSPGVHPERLPFERSAAEWGGREDAYGKWLARELRRNGAADPDNLPRLTSFKRDKLYRRAGQAAGVLQRPNAVMEGILRVADAEAFLALLRRGVGRHRAFGFGMLLLRPLQRIQC